MVFLWFSYGLSMVFVGEIYGKIPILRPHQSFPAEVAEGHHDPIPAEVASTLAALAMKRGAVKMGCVPKWGKHRKMLT